MNDPPTAVGGIPDPKTLGPRPVFIDDALIPETEEVRRLFARLDSDVSNRLLSRKPFSVHTVNSYISTTKVLRLHCLLSSGMDLPQVFRPCKPSEFSPVFLSCSPTASCSLIK